MDKKNLTTKETFDLAVQNHKNNNLQAAENLYKEILKTRPNFQGAHNNLGNVLKDLGEFQEAISCYEKAIQIQPDYANPYYNLGSVLDELGEHQKAISCYEKAIQIQPNYTNAHYNLGALYFELGEHQKAISCYEKAIQINPNFAGAHNNLGNVLKNLGEFQKAISCFEKAIQINPNFAGTHNNLGLVHKELGEHQKAISCYEKAIQINPNFAGAHNNLGAAYFELGEHQKAISCYEKVIQMEPNNLTSHWLSMNTFPIIYKNLKEIDIYRKRFEDGIKKINHLLDTQSQYTKKQIVDAMKSSTNFYLSYQGKNDINLQKKYANLIERLTEKIYPQFHQKRAINKSIKFIKIGFVSSFFKNHTVSMLFKNWIIKLNRNFFSVFVYYIGNEFDQITHQIKDSSNNFFNHTDIDQLISRISKDKLDILVYLDIGMDPITQILASLKLASIQCTTWGHPVTSGLKNIDYFLSSELMKKKESQKYYSEKLINLPGIGIDYDHCDISNIKKLNIVKKSDKIIFLNLQSLFKLLPQNDHIYLEILKKQPNCCFWFIHGLKNSISSIFKKRISKLFKNHNLSFNECSIFYPRCTKNEYLGLIEQSDVILDSLNWSGGNTSLEAISLNKPIVTCPSEFMRGRHTYSILRKLNIEETIASSKEKYVEIAVKLAKNNDFRNSIINKIVKNKKKLFNDDKSIRFLEEMIRKRIASLK